MRPLRILPLSLLLLLAAIYCLVPLTPSADFWAYAAMGKWMWLHHQLPHQTLFIWSIDPQPIVAPSWLSELFYFGLMQLGGEEGGPWLGIGVTALMVAGSFAVLWKSADPRWHAGWKAMIFAIAVQSSHQRFGARPETFSALFFAIELALLNAWEKRRAAGKLWPSAMLFMIPMFALWSNLHGGVLLGLIILGVTAIVDLVQSKGSPPARLLLALAIACTVASGINPYGWQALAASQNIRSWITTSTVLEWMPLLKSPIENPPLLLGFAILLCLSALAWGVNRERRWSHGLWLLLGAVALLQARRQGWLFCELCLAVLGAYPLAWLQVPQSNNEPGVEAKAKPATVQNGISVAAVVYLVFSILYVAPRRPLEWRPVWKYLPSELTTWVDEAGVHGNVFATMDGAPYLNWRWGERRPLFITTFLESFPPQLLEAYTYLIATPSKFLEAMDALCVTAIVVPHHEADATMLPLVQALNNDPAWRLAYVRPDGGVWLRQGRLPGSCKR